MRSHTIGGSTAKLLEETIGENFERIVEEHPDRDALIEVQEPGRAPRKWTYQELNAEVDLVARGLLALGVNSGDRVGLWSPNAAEWTVIQYATAKIGAILVNVNPAYRVNELDYVVNQSGMRMLFLAPNDKNSDYLSMARQVHASIESLQKLVFLPDHGLAGLEAGVPDNDGELDYGQVRELAQSVPGSALTERMAQLDPHEVINMQYTSGTTGFPKGASLSHHNILNNAYMVGVVLGYTPEDKVVIPVPFYHCFGMVLGNLNALSHGATTIISGRSFKPDQALQAVNDFSGTSLYGVPTMFIAELALPHLADYDLSTLRTGIIAGSLCPPDVMERVMGDLNMKGVVNAYGMTETSPVSTVTSPTDTFEQRVTTVGRTMDHLETKIIDPMTGDTVERGEIGELCTRGYAVMKGYWNQPEKTTESIDEDGWMHSGDLARMDEEGYIRVEGRIKDMIVRGGENIYPREIEEFLFNHPSIQDVQVIGVPDEKYGEELLASIIMKPGAAPLDAQAIRDYAHGKLAHYKIPRYVEIRESFPLTVSGKVRKVQLREEAVERSRQAAASS